MNQQKLNKMVNESLRDIPSDEDVSSGEDDPSILVKIYRNYKISFCYYIFME